MSFSILRRKNSNQINNICIKRQINANNNNVFLYLLYLGYLCLILWRGDLIGWMNKQKHRRFIDPDAKFICASVLEAFEYLHARDIIYRDLKPENVVLSANGHFKLADFGLAKRIKGIGKTYSFVGTPEYMAPEIILQRGHDRAVDYWTFGIFIFEMLCGRTPFRNDNTKRVFFNILQGIDSVRIPTYVCLEAQHLIRKLCRPISSERLGMQKLGINDIKNHAWFQDFDLETFAMHSQFKLSLTSKTDTSFVEKYPANTNGSRRIPPIENSGWDSSF